MINLIDERKQGINESNMNGDDLLSILINDELFKDNQSKIIDEIITFSVAGTATIAATTANLIFFLNQNLDCKKKFVQEID